jgi:hypothetical protein
MMFMSVYRQESTLRGKYVPITKLALTELVFYY